MYRFPSIVRIVTAVNNNISSSRTYASRSGDILGGTIKKEKSYGFKNDSNLTNQQKSDLSTIQQNDQDGNPRGKAHQVVMLIKETDDTKIKGRSSEEYGPDNFEENYSNVTKVEFLGTFTSQPKVINTDMFGMKVEQDTDLIDNKGSYSPGFGGPTHIKKMTVPVELDIKNWKIKPNRDTTAYINKDDIKETLDKVLKKNGELVKNSSVDDDSTKK